MLIRVSIGAKSAIFLQGVIIEAGLRPCSPRSADLFLDRPITLLAKINAL